MSTNNNAATATEAKKLPYYTIRGTIESLKTGTGSNGKTWAGFTLSHGDKKTRAVAFGDKADELLASFGEGSSVAVRGFYENENYTDASGAARKSSKLVVRWSGVPLTKEQRDALKAEKAQKAA